MYFSVHRLLVHLISVYTVATMVYSYYSVMGISGLRIPKIQRDYEVLRVQ